MQVELITKEDLVDLRQDLVQQITKLFAAASTPPKKWLKSDEVKKILKVSAGTLQTLRINGILKYTKIGGIIYYDYEHIQRTMEENKT